eukprot:jgi/Undpi1/5601/HiC_scaffold_2.g00877.m1
MSEGSGAMAVSNVGAYSCASTPQEPPNSRTKTSPDPEFTSEATPSCCYGFSSSSLPAGEEFIVIDGPLPAGVQPLCDFNSSSSSCPPPMQTGLIVVDGPSPADGLGSHGNASTAEMSPDSAHTHPDAPSSVCTGTDCPCRKSVPVQTEEAESGDISAVEALPWDPKPLAGEGPSTTIKLVCIGGGLLLLLKLHNGWTPAGKGASITTNSSPAGDEDDEKS